MEQSICKIKSLCFKLLIVCLFNCQVCFSQVTTSINISLKQHIGNINATALSVDGKHLASVSSDMSIKIWRYPEYNLMTTIVLPRRKGSLSQLDCIKFHPLYPNLILVSGGILIDGYLDEESKVEYYIYIIDWKKKILIDQIGGFKSYITSMDFSNSGETLIASSAYQNFNLYNSKNMEIICKGEINDEEIYSAKFLQDSLFIINSDLHKRTYRLCKNNRVKIVDKLSRRATNRAYSADSSNDYMVGNIEKLQYREYGGADIKYKNDTLYIQYNNEPLRCFIWPTKVIAVESNLKSNSKTMPGDYNISDFFMGTLMLNGDYIDTERYLLVQKRDFAGTGIYWSTVLPAVAKTRPILINNNYFVLSLSDGTIRWYSSETGKEQLALFIDKEGEYILWLPDGRYYSPSISNSHMIEWRYQNFMNITTKNARTERGKQYDIEAVYNKLKNIYKHKNIYQEITGINLSNYIRSGSPMEYIYNNLQNGKLLRSRKLKEVILQSKLKEESLSKINTYSIFPKIKIDSLYTYKNKYEITYSISNYNPYKDGSIKFNVIGDGKPIEYNYRPINYTTGVISFSNIDIKSDLFLAISSTDGQILDAKNIITAKKNTLPINNIRYLSIGVSEYKSESIGDLESATNDAYDIEDILLNFTKKKGNAESLVPAGVTITNKNVTSATILNNIKKLQLEAGDNDMSVFYYSGHGSIEAEEYYLATNDNSNLGRGINANKILNELDKIKGYKVIIIDACYAGAITKKTYKNSAIFVSSREDEVSYDGKIYSQSVFTQELTNAIINNYNNARFTYSLLNKLLAERVRLASNSLQNSSTSIDPMLNDKIFFINENSK